MSVDGALPSDREIFRMHYEEDQSHWGKGSGAGSNAYYTIEYRSFLDKFIRMNNVRSIVDIGCGDWQFSRFLNLDGIRYVGLDVVPSVVERNTQLYGAEFIEFKIMPPELEDAPSGDLLIMKDVLQHLPDAVIFEFAKKVFPKFKYGLITNSFIKLQSNKNIDIGPGAFRCLDLAVAPYSLRGCYVLEFTSPLWERIRTFLYHT